MAEQWSDLGKEEPSGSVKNGSWEDGSVATDDASPASEPAEGVAAEADVAAPETDEASMTVEMDATADVDAAPAPMDVAGATDATDPTDAAPDVGDASAATAADPAAVDPGTAFLAELARAMQSTAASERLRIETEIDRQRGAQIDRIRARQSAEAERMRELAAEELQSIDAWAEGEMDRIRGERTRRAAALDDDLATSLAEHSAQTDDEVGRIESAIATYRADVDAFFADLDTETDLVALAQRAMRRPAFPDLDAVASGAAAMADSPTQSDVAGEPEAEAAVGVMDPASIGETAGESWEAAPEPVAATEETIDPQESTLIDEEEPVGVGAGEPARKSLLQSVQVVHPTSWLHRNRNGEDGSA